MKEVKTLQDIEKDFREEFVYPDNMVECYDCEIWDFIEESCKKYAAHKDKEIEELKSKLEKIEKITELNINDYE